MSIWEYISEIIYVYREIFTAINNDVILNTNATNNITNDSVTKIFAL